ncbi:MAG TPA: type II secretion system protein GspG [Phycisphaerae bacterium]|nr:type II secretion system protein GspG [Phycisphaerae bacterium]HRR87497.1 type II secretion system protein GspG [Phycisphaerae bacterium]
MLYSTFVTLTAPCCTGCGGSSQTKAEMASLSSVLALYQLHLGAYPTSLDDLVVRPSGEAGARWKGPYVENPGTLRDTWGRPLRYKSPGVKNLGHYDLWSAGPDGVDGTADDINNW